MTGWDDRGNARAAWDKAYEEGGVWDEFKGGPRTRAFAEALLRFLDPIEHEYLSQPGRTILDWGCGLGELTAAFRARYPEAVVTGLDFSSTAIARARKSYGGPFIRADKIEDEYDVIIVSNVHEHVVDYLALTQDHLSKCRDMYIVLTPFEENLGAGEPMTIDERHKAGHAHVHRFNEQSFPHTIGAFTCHASGLVEPGALWPGQQLALVYSRVYR